MAHELEMINGVAQMAYAGEKPWHGLGVKVSNDLTPAQMMEAAGLDWRVRELKTFVNFHKDGKKTTIPTGQKALVRETDGKVLTQVGPNWNPVQNEQAFEFFQEFVMNGDMEMNTAGSLKDGQIVWALAKVNEQFELFNGDRVESFLLFSNPHQYGKTVNVKFTPIRVVCNNTLTASLGSKSKTMEVKLNHRSAFDAENVKMTLGIARQKMSDYKEMASFLGSKRYKSETLTEFLTGLFGTKTGTVGDLTRTGEQVRELVTTQPGSEYAPESWWQAYNAVTYFTDHIAGRSNDTRMESAWFGANQKKKIDALKSALDFAEAA